MPPLFLCKPAQYTTLLDKYDTILMDLDGVIWNGAKGDVLTPHIKETLLHFRSLKKQLAFITNNATLSRSAYVHKFATLGIQVALEEIFTCGSASASYLRQTVLPMCQAGRDGVYVIGQAGLEEELRDEGLEWKGGTDPEDDVLMPYQDFSTITPDPSIGVVLFSFQMHLNYKQLSKAFNYLASNKGCKLVLTNDDSTVLIPDGVCPGEGAMAKVLFGARKGLVPIIVGKPHQPLLDVVHAALKFDPERTIMVGDRLETDILFGKRGGVSTLLVLTGSSKAHDIAGLSDLDEPDYVTDALGDLLVGKSE